ncbi:putative short-chain dehydrogenase reductase sdr protein [Botrytis fragariae]|uniref:Putative short-chain dehydrogenase reductase sdr protein n=1 Tax=Botrytis fragariae TaxID=1964551 RepID=A0A8H6EI96_9HELO|nr:putative short-chain dehydrogenase reductase sdr protein [Botrytis fragariae]KAF5873257.1 putative short-chain dehydrogenase reductase sdr protein [Botrytis fragariae]
MAWSLVCPANRGIGFYLTRHLLQNTQLPVVATSRKDIEGARKSILTDLDVDPKRLTVLEVDVTNESTISSAAEKCSSLFPSSTHHLRLAFSIPGVLYPEKSPAQLDQSQIQHTFAVNTIGPLLLTKHFSPFLPPKRLDLSSSPDTKNLPPHALWLNMSARVGSTSDNALGGWYSYRASKAATGLSKEFWGGVKEGKLFSPEFAVEKLWDVAMAKGIESRGRCWDWRGVEISP